MVVQGCCGDGVLSGCQATIRELIRQNCTRTLEYRMIPPSQLNSTPPQMCLLSLLTD